VFGFPRFEIRHRWSTTHEHQTTAYKRLGISGLAEQLQTISVACRKAGISRSHYYEMKEAFDKYGRGPVGRPRVPSQAQPELEDCILQMTEQYPT
jgi:hypothetical protein